MITRLCYTILLSALLVVPNLAEAQDMPAGKWWYNPKVVKALNLTKPEVRQIDRLYAQNRKQLIRLKGNVQQEQLELDNLLGRKNSDDDITRMFHLSDPRIASRQRLCCGDA